jgi:hypothetical protein
MIKSITTAILLCGSLSATAQTVDELKRALAERDATIRGLRQQLEALEAPKNKLRPQALSAVAPQEPRPSKEDEELERALERTLVQQGGLLLPYGVYELQPEATYAHWDKSRGPLREETGTALTFRAGLPWQSQLQLRLPYLHVATATSSATALGDASLSLSKQLARERQGWPGIVASLGWSARTGRDGFDGTAPTGAGFNTFSGAITLVKRHDPLMYYGGISYAHSSSRSIGGVNVAPGDARGLRFGGILAATPDTAVNVGLNLAFGDRSRFNGQPLADSDATSGTLQIGVGTVLTRDVLLNLSAEARIEGNVPNYRLTASLPIRF